MPLPLHKLECIFIARRNIFWTLISFSDSSILIFTLIELANVAVQALQAKFLLSLEYNESISMLCGGFRK